MIKTQTKEAPMKKSERETLKLFRYIQRKLKNYPDIGILGISDIDWFNGKVNLFDMQHIKPFTSTDRRVAKSFEFDVIFPVSYKQDYAFYLNDEPMKLYQIARKIISRRQQ